MVEEYKMHPAMNSILEYMNSIPYAELCLYLEAFSSTAIEGNELAAECAETLGRWLRGEKMGERFLMGLAWTLRNMRENNE